MDKPYFLTRQTANLMEDFARELQKGSTFYLLYGEPRVGKTRLLEELQHSRLADKTVHWIDLGNALDDLAGADLSREIERLFGQAAPGDIIVADHFERSLKKNRHQLFISWSTDGVDKGLNLIVASNLEGFNELRQLSQQYQARVQSFQLMPLDGDEIDAFLGHYLFPNHPLGKLTMPAPLRRQIAEARGVIGSLIDIADHDGSHIETAPLADRTSMRSGGRVIAAALVMFAAAIGVGWYFFVAPESGLVENSFASGSTVGDEFEVAVAPESAVSELIGDGTYTTASLLTDEPAPVAVEVEAPGSEAQAVSAVAEIEAGETAADRRPVPADDPPALDEEPAEAVAVSASAGDQVTTPAPEADLIVDQSIDASATARAVEPEAVDAVGAPIASAGLAGTGPEPQAVAVGADLFPRDRLLLELERSIDWLYARDEGRGTVQVLLLSADRFDPAGYFDYVDDLGRRQVDTGQLRIFKTFTGGKVVYSVFFGDYESRRAALRAIDQLPNALQQAGPIPRSVGGIWQEIRRLPAGN